MGHSGAGGRLTASEVSTFEVIIIIAVCGLVLLANLATSMLYPVVWMDEVMFSDPAVRLAIGKGFTSTFWPMRSADALFIGYVPLYPLILSVWFRIGRVAPEWERALNYCLITLTALAGWWAIVRAKLFGSGIQRVLLVCLILFGYGISFSYRSRGADTLMAFLVVIVVLASTIVRPGPRRVALVLLSALLPLAGLPLLLLGAALVFLLAVFCPKTYRPDLFAVLIGLGLGVITLLGFYYAVGALDDVFNSTRGHMSESLLRSIFNSVPYHHANNIPKDPSFTALFLIGVILVGLTVRRANGDWRTPLVFGLTAATVIPLTLMLFGKFPTYYAWMAYLPLAVGVLSAYPVNGEPRWRKQLFLASVVAVCLVGLPFQLALALYTRADHDYGSVRRALEQTIRPDDSVYCDYAAYYVAVVRAREVIGPMHLDTITTSERSRLSLVIVDPDSEGPVLTALGGHWQRVGPAIEPSTQMLTKGVLVRDLRFGLFDKIYRLRAYRRDGL
jgi:hypothetical protein